MKKILPIAFLILGSIGMAQAESTGGSTGSADNGPGPNSTSPSPTSVSPPGTPSTYDTGHINTGSGDKVSNGSGTATQGTDMNGSSSSSGVKGKEVPNPNSMNNGMDNTGSPQSQTKSQ